MMRWWLDRGVDGFRMDVINLISKDAALPDGARARRHGPCGDGAALLRRRPAHARVPAGDAPARCSPAATGELLTVGEMPGVTVDAGRALHRPGAPRGRHGVPVRARGARPRPGASGDAAPLELARAEGVPRPLAGRARRGRAGTACTGTTTTSRASSPGSATTASTGSRRRRLLATVLHLHRGHALRLPGRGARHDERAVRRASTTSATSSRSTTTPTAIGAGPRSPDDGARGAAAG